MIMKTYRTLRSFERSLEKGIKQIINVNKFEPGAKKISEYKNKFSGRCFVIGNGPSLTIADLNTLKAHNRNLYCQYNYVYYCLSHLQ